MPTASDNRPAEAQVTDQVTFTGVVDRIIFHNESNGYAVLSVLPDMGERSKGFSTKGVTCTGVILGPKGGVRLRLIGHWVMTPKYGRQFAFESAEEVVPTSDIGLIAYLSSGLIQGVGQELARRIVKKFGENTVDVMDNEPERLVTVQGIGKKNWKGIAESWKEHRVMRELMQFLQPHGISPTYGVRIFNEYGAQSVSIIKENPYRLAMDIRGIGFRIADSIAIKLGFDKASPLRQQAGLLYILQRFAEEGHVYCPKDRLYKRAVDELLLEEALLDDALETLQGGKKARVVLEEIDEESAAEEGGEAGVAVYLSSYHTCEAKTAFYLERLKQMPRNVYFRNIEKELKLAIGSQPFRLAEAQVDAVRMASKNKVMVLTGGPGTGKTTIIKAIIHLFESVTQKILLAAPTGRAAKRMSEATGYNAQTLHRLLGYSVDMEFERGEDKPLSCDLLIVDEASMMDITLFFHLLKAVPTGAVVIFVGDVFQLPSVGPGSVLSDIIRSERIPVAELNQIFRQSASSDIVMNAHLINNGEMPNLSSRGRETDFYFMTQDDPEEAAKLVVDLASRRLPAHYHLDAFSDIQVLSPMHKGPLGTQALNELLQDALNPKGTVIRRGEASFRLGDKVMQCKNDYDKDVFNGDIGRISKIDAEQKSLLVTFDDRDVEYEFKELDELQVAYAITVHKSQGSEYPIVVIPVSMSHYVMLQRNLIYTGITRGKKIVVVVGEQNALARAVRNNHPTMRYTRLAWRLRNYSYTPLNR